MSVFSEISHAISRIIPGSKSTVTDIPHGKVFESGDVLVNEVLEAIRTRRSILLTGPRGCGKTYCTDKGIRKALKENLIGEFRFLQGNRELPRDLLSEDMLVLRSFQNEDGTVKTVPVMIPALAIRPSNYDDREYQKSYVERKRINGFRKDDGETIIIPEWPAIPESLVENSIEAAKYWEDQDWVVLYFDEINRFSDGFLDSLLSLTEERKMVRQGKSYFVPIIVVATANPPGYDPTAKKLSPPLAARISRSFRISTPSLKTLVGTIIRDKLAEINKAYPWNNRLSLYHPLVTIASMATLCLWGTPGKIDGKINKGCYYLESDTRNILLKLIDIDHNKELKIYMEELSRLIVFGPDARAISDWLACAMGRYLHEHQKQVNNHPTGTQEDREALYCRVMKKCLLDTAAVSLVHKVRENFNEGAEPDKLCRLEGLIDDVVNLLFSSDLVLRLLAKPKNELQLDREIIHHVSIKSLMEDIKRFIEKMNPNEKAKALINKIDSNHWAYFAAVWLTLLGTENLHWLSKKSTHETQDVNWEPKTSLILTFGDGVITKFWSGRMDKSQDTSNKIIIYINELAGKREYFSESFQWMTGETVAKWVIHGVTKFTLTAKESSFEEGISNDALKQFRECLSNRDALEILLPLEKGKVFADEEDGIYETLKKLTACVWDKGFYRILYFNQ